MPTITILFKLYFLVTYFLAPNQLGSKCSVLALHYVHCAPPRHATSCRLCLTLEQGTDFPQPDWPLAAELARAHLEEEDRQPHAHQRQHVGDQKCTCKCQQT